MGAKYTLDVGLVTSLMGKEFGGKHGFIKAWEEGELSASASAAPSQATLYRWLRSGLPDNLDGFLAFFSALDIDPMAAMDWNKSGVWENFSHLRLAVYLALTKGHFRHLLELYGPNMNWPNNDLLVQHFSRKWCTYQFENDAALVSEKYVIVELDLDADARPRPFVMHIAYRTGTNRDGLWRPYGSIVRREGTDFLFHENGYKQAIATNEDDNLEFETYCGPSSLEFKIISLHPFTGKAYFGRQKEGRLRFPGR
jgi:hypothetical protein